MGRINVLDCASIKNVRINTKNWQPVRGEGLLFFFSFLSNFSVCMKLLFFLNTQTVCDFIWLVDKILPKCAVFCCSIIFFYLFF